jgi:isoquinoline 1-oxidoreductase beta subunit
MTEMPVIEVHIVPSADEPHGVGEPGVPPIAPAVANAVADAVGARLTSLPITAEKVLAALWNASSSPSAR